jgi:hypothetical protein
LGFFFNFSKSAHALLFLSTLAAQGAASTRVYARDKPKARFPAAGQPAPAEIPRWPTQLSAQNMDILAVDAKGNAGQLTWGTKVTAIWVDGAPLLRLWVEIPSEFSRIETPKNLPPLSKSSYTVMDSANGSPFTASAMAIDMVSGSRLSPVPVRLIQPGKVTELSLVISPDLEHPSVFSQESCENLGIRITTLKPGAHYLFAAASCSAQSGARVQVHLFHSREVVWSRVQKTGASRQKDGSLILWLEKPKSSGTLSVTVSVKDGASGISVFRIVRAGDSPVKRAGFVVGLGASELNYLEPGLGVHLLETGFTGKVTGYYLLKPGMFDLGVNAFITLLPIVDSPGAIVSARFYGANARAGWQLPIHPAGLTLSLSGGWYFWGMLVPGAAYGVSFLSGPQAFLLLKGNLKDARTYSAYFKFAPISGSFSPSFANREVALGGAYPLSAVGAAHPLSLTLDLADAAYTSPDGLNSLRLTSLSLGVQMGF